MSGGAGVKVSAIKREEDEALAVERRVDRVLIVDDGGGDQLRLGLRL